MAKIKTKYICQECGYETGKWLGRCPSCNNFSTFSEEIIENTTSKSNKISATNKALDLESIAPISEVRTKTKIGELDRVLGGGIVQGSLTLVGGDPGIGKSTLLLQICEAIGESGKKILYVSGEESAQQIKLRATRLNISTKNLLLLSETNFNIIENTIKELSPDLVIIDSIQTVFLDDLSSAPGSVTQVRECTARIMRIGKGDNISIFIVGHVTKDGAIAGPRILEHMVDTVLYFEGERLASYRILRAVKNRFGSTNEIGVFEMRQIGLVEINNPSEYMLSGRPIGANGSSVTCSIEGTRPILAEVQSLVSYTTFNIPRRMATGMDFNRIILLIAVLEKKLNLQLGSYDVYVNLAGGIKILEPALDASVACSIVSSYKNKPIDAKTLIFGEIGLSGELRAVSFCEKRVMEALKLGFEKVIIPKDNLKEVSSIKDIKISPVSNINELLKVALG
ncbi:DNA repair protein RadA [uncultured Tyzzerella sp.]|uniref:DNA repair protein RadA n=1 Tax=uncultured Tyzzerella sp. TaxID=2321398 RepID=UPI0029421C9D|nr:DNA repair protein RadA [uncultured Tyzzerella sp.]